MALTPDFTNKIVYSDASITDVVAFHDDLRDIEVSDAGMLSPVIHTYKEVPLGGGAIFPAVAFINGWTLQFPTGNWELRGGNVDVTINPVAGCYVKVTQSAAYAVSSALGGGGGPTVAEIVAGIMAQAQITPIHADTRKINNVQLTGSGVSGDSWRPV